MKMSWWSAKTRLFFFFLTTAKPRKTTQNKAKNGRIRAPWDPSGYRTCCLAAAALLVWFQPVNFIACHTPPSLPHLPTCLCYSNEESSKQIRCSSFEAEQCVVKQKSTREFGKSNCGPVFGFNISSPTTSIWCSSNDLQNTHLQHVMHVMRVIAVLASWVFPSYCTWYNSQRCVIGN